MSCGYQSRLCPFQMTSYRTQVHCLDRNPASDPLRHTSIYLRPSLSKQIGATAHLCLSHLDTHSDVLIKLHRRIRFPRRLIHDSAGEISVPTDQRILDHISSAAIAWSSLAPDGPHRMFPRVGCGRHGNSTNRSMTCDGTCRCGDFRDTETSTF